VTIPTGTVTFLFTDIEGSTRLWEADSGAMAEALARHDAILRGAIESRGGFVFSTAGDAFSAAFADVADAVAAARAAQVALSAQEWPEVARIRVRMGLHTGEADERGSDYFGPVVNRAARVMDAGHGGQVIASDVTASLVGRDQLTYLGEHVLKGLEQPMGLHQVSVPGGSAQFAPVRTAGAGASTIRAPLSETIGRQEEIASVQELVTSNRVVTLTGAGGCGKTRLALEVGNRVMASFPGGVFFVDLGRVSSDDLVWTAIADGLGATVPPGADAAAVACSFLAGRRALVVMDNCEHLIDEAAQATEAILAGCLQVGVLATSRELLEVEGEHVVRVSGMNEVEGVRLFRARSGSADGSDQVIAEICRRLDGLPLAIELAAARASVLSVEEIKRNLDDRFGLLTGGRRRTRGRQQTLETTVEWSYDLLAQDEQQALRALSVMPGSFGFDLAAGILGRSKMATVELLDGLVARSLIQARPNAKDRHDRYRLLETIREFGAARLRQAGEDREVRDRHVEALAAVLHPGEFPIYEVADGDVRDDLRAAHDWILLNDDKDRATRLAGPIVNSVMTDGGLARVMAFLDWLGDTDQEEVVAKVAGLQALTAAWSSNTEVAWDACARALAADPDSVGMALARLVRSLTVMSVDAGRAKREIESARPVIEAADEPQLSLFLSYCALGAAGWAEDLDEALTFATELSRGADKHQVAQPFARGGLLNALCLRGEHEAIERVLATPPPPPVGGSWTSSHVRQSADGMAMGHLGRFADGRRHLASVWDGFMAFDLPLVHDEVLLGLAVCAMAAGEREEAKVMLNDTIWYVRHNFDSAHLYRVLSDLADVPADQAREWRARELLRRAALRPLIESESRTRHAIDAEFQRLGLR
jgi:predicted ATPase/class 3 adenylate cyclase